MTLLAALLFLGGLGFAAWVADCDIRPLAYAGWVLGMLAAAAGVIIAINVPTGLAS